MIVIDCQPITIVDNEGFISLINALKPKYQMLNRKDFTETVIPYIATRVKTIIATQLKEDAEYVSFTIDVWNSDV